MNHDRAEALADQVTQLRRELSLAEEGLANATQEIEAAKHDIERLMAVASAEATEAERLRYEISRLNHRCQAMGWLLYPHSDPPREAVAGDVGWPG